MLIAFDLNTTLVNLCCRLSNGAFTSCHAAWQALIVRLLLAAFGNSGTRLTCLCATRGRYRMHSSRERSAASCLMICNAERTDWQCQSGLSGISKKAADGALEEVSISRGNWQKLRRRKGGNT